MARRRLISRAAWAAAIATALVGVLLAAWFVTGWREVRARQAALRAAPGEEARQLATALSHELRGELDTLVAREAARPYFHYQNLFHDPHASAGMNVAPSPLARAPEDPLVLGYFQIDAKGAVTTPTVNDDVPDLSDPSHLAEHRAFRDEVARELVEPLRAGATPQPAAQVVQLDPGSYWQNYASNAVYQQQPAPQPAARNASVSILVGALAWRTLAFEGAPALVAVRRVETPDGALAQGFVIDRGALTSKLAARAGEMVAELVPHADADDAAPGWQLLVTANPHAIARAYIDAGDVASGFVRRFVAIAFAAVLLAACLVVLVARAETLARERSQFAAAAAHELRTPLAGLQLYGDMLAGGLGDPDKARDYARRLGEEAARLGRVVSNVLGFSQLERGTLGVQAEPGELGTALRELAERAEPALDRAGAVLALEVAPELRARFDRDALARIVGNLLDNAEKYARGADDRTIDLCARDLGDHIEIAVTDRGPGITDERVLFAPFARGSNADAPPGLGLGLALSRSLARAMGGDLVHRAGDGGATFVVTLPRA